MAAIEHRDLRSALEFAVLIAAEGQKRRPPLKFPRELKAHLGATRLPTAALGRVRRAIETDPPFRSAISAGALPELVDEVGRLWLRGAEGWEAQAAALLAERREEEASDDLRRDLKRADKRRLAAEQATARLQVELLRRDEELAAHATDVDMLRADLDKARESASELRTELIDTRNELRHARDRERAARERHAEPAVVAAVHDDVAPPVDLAVLGAALEQARALVARLDETLRGAEAASLPGSATRPGREPLALPGGVISTSAEAAAHLLRAGVPIIVDGYNVAKLAWPQRPLEQQRTALIERAENLARRVGADLTIVFDGASLVGAHRQGRRDVRVVFSPEGVSADDVIRAEVAALALTQQVVVVTNDREIVDDMRAQAVNVVPSNAFIAAF